MAIKIFKKKNDLHCADTCEAGIVLLTVKPFEYIYHIISVGEEAESF